MPESVRSSQIQTGLAQCMVVPVSTASAALLATNGMPAGQALLIVAGGGVAGALSLRLSTFRAGRAALRTFLNPEG